MGFKEKIVEKKEKAVKTYNTIQLIIALISSVFFIVTLIKWLGSNYGDSKLLPFVIGSVALYIIICIIYIIITARNSKDVKQDVKRFTQNLKLVKALMNLTLLVSAALVSIESFRTMGEDATFFNKFTAFFALALAVLKLLSGIRKVFKNIKKIRKTDKKIKAQREKENKKLENK